MPIQTYRAISADETPGVVLHTGDYPTRRAGIIFCAANGISLANADLRNEQLDGANLSGLHVPHADLRGASMRNVTATGPAIAEFSGCIFDATTVITGTMTHANFACTRPSRFRVEAGVNTRLRGCDWAGCPDVIVLPVAKAEQDRVGKVVALRNGTGWKVHAGDAVLSEAAAKEQLVTNAAPEVAARYAGAFAFLELPQTVALKAAITAGPP